jgi:ApbE superfamily uncharacterized protein (UPF0280 family)
MKSINYQRRFYRDLVKAKGLYGFEFIDRETDLQVFSSRPPEAHFIAERVRQYRHDIENYIARDRRFLVSLKPIPVELSAPEIVKEMAQSAKTADVGPMAAVAGAIADFLGRDLVKKGCREVIIENGGDIFLKVAKARNIGIYAGKSRAWNSLKIKVRPSQTPMGVCSSSGTIGHSLSFGIAECAIILAKNAVLADAVATATLNRVRSPLDVQKALEFALSVKGVRAAAIICNKKLATLGKIEFCA